MCAKKNTIKKCIVFFIISHDILQYYISYWCLENLKLTHELTTFMKWILFYGKMKNIRCAHVVHKIWSKTLHFETLDTNASSQFCSARVFITTAQLMEHPRAGKRCFIKNDVSLWTHGQKMLNPHPSWVVNQHALNYKSEKLFRGGSWGCIIIMH